jgi:TP901 family phage tail tape measure protein
MAVKKVEYKIEVNSDTKGVTALQSSVSGLAGSFSKVGLAIVAANQAIDLLGRGFSAFNNALAPVIKLEHQMRVLEQTIGQSRQSNVALSQSVLDLQKAYGGSTLEIANGLQKLLQESTLNTADAVKVLTEAVRLSDTGITSVDNAVTLLNKTMKVFGFEANNAAAINDVFVIGARRGALSLEQMSSVLDSLAPMAKTLGVGFEELVAIMATMGEQGLSTGEIATSLRSAFTALARPTTELGESLDSVTKASMTAAISQKGFVKALADSVNSTGKGTDAIAKMFGRITAASGIATLTSAKGMAAYQKTLEELAASAKDVGGVVSGMLKEVDKTAFEQLDALSANFKAIFTEIGLIVLQWVTPFVTGLNHALSSFQTFLAQLKASDMQAITTLVQALTAAFIGLGLAIAGVKIAAFVTAMGGLVAVIKAAAVAFSALAIPIVAMIAAFAGVYLVLENAEAAWNNLYILLMRGLIGVEKQFTVLSFAIKRALGFDASDAESTIGKLDHRLKVLNNQQAVAMKRFNTGLIGDAFKEGAKLLDLFSAKTQVAANEQVKLPPIVKQVNEELKQVGLTTEQIAAKNKELLDSYNQLVSAVNALEIEAIKRNNSEIAAIDILLERQLQLVNQTRHLMQLNGLYGEQESQRLNELVTLYQEKAEAEKASINLKLLEEQKAMYLEAQDLLGKGTAKFISEYDTRIAKIKELQGAGAMSPEEGARATQLADVAQQAQAPFMMLGDMVGEGMLGTLSAGFGGLSAGFSSMMAGPIGMIAKLPDLLGGAIDGLNSFMDSWLEFPDMLANALPDVINKLSTFAGDLIGTLGDKLPEIIYNLTTSLQKFVPNFIASLLRGIPKLIKGIINSIPALVAGLIDGLMEGIIAIGEALMNIFTGNFDGKAIAESGMEAVKQVGDAVTGVGQQLFGFVGDSGAQQAQENAKQILEASRQGSGWFTRAWEALKGVAKWVGDLFLSVWGTLVNIIASGFHLAMSLVVTTIEFIVGVFIAAGTLVSDLFSAVFNFAGVIFGTIIDTIKFLFVDIVWGLVFKPIIDLFTVLFVDVVWGLVFKPIIDLFKSMWDFVSTLFTDPIAAFKKLWEDVKNIFADIGTNIGKLWDNIKNIFANIGTSISTAFTNAVSILTNFFSGLGTFVTAAFSGVINFFSNLGSTIWTALSGAWGNVTSFFSNLFSFTPSAGVVENWLGFDFPWVKFAEGGTVPGVAKVAGDSLKNDTVPALLSAGEYVLPRSVTQDKDLMQFILSLINSNKKVEKHGFGDFIGGIGKGISSAAGAVWDGAKAVGGAVIEGAKWVGDLLVPDWVQELWNSLSQFVSGIDFKAFVTDPLNVASNAIRSSFDFMREAFKSSVPAMLGFAQGGLVGGSGTGDTVPAMLTPGEFVINRDAVANLGTGLLNKLNSGQNGGGSTTTNYAVTLNIKTEQPIDEAFVKNRLMPEIEKSLRRGSLDGKRILSPTGVRA